MNPNKGRYALAIQLLLIVVVALLFDVLIFKNLNIKYDFNVPLIDILGFIITICIALYIAHIVEAGRERKQNINDIIISIISSQIQECDDIQRAIYLNNLTYAQACSFQKKIFLSCKNIENIIKRANCNCLDLEVGRCLSKISGERTLNKLLTDIKYQNDSPDNYLEVSDGMICKISPARKVKIIAKLDNVKQELYKVWVEISLIEPL